MFSEMMYDVTDTNPVLTDELEYDPSTGTGATIADAEAWANALAHEALIYDLDPLGGSVSPY